MTNKYKSRGFTLIELMVTVAIVGILASIAYPNYRQYTLRAHRAEGLTTLQQVAVLQERYYSNNSTYAPDMVTLGFPDGDTENGYFNIVIAPCAGGVITRCFQLTATALGSQADDEAEGTACTPLTLDSTGVKDPADCW